MPVVFKNPDLTDYFVVRDDVRRGTPPASIAPITQPYEAGRIVVFPKLKLDIDFGFWASLPTDDYPALKKLSSTALSDDFRRDPLLDRKLAAAALPPEMEQAMRAQMHRIYEQVLPIYARLFGDYRFTRRQVVWRLNTIRNENLHVDTYKEPLPQHFARLFINLDDQPRIWNTSYTIDQIYQRFGSVLDERLIREGDGDAIYRALNGAAFGGKSAIWWDRQPRHVVYFDPGDVWCVDSRQVAHQIFYGRRAVSFDFFVDPASMAQPDKHYLRLAEGYREASAAVLGVEIPVAEPQIEPPIEPLAEAET